MSGDGGWKQAQVAKAQLKLVQRQLANPLAVDPFAAFLRAMAHAPGDCLLDVGCGVGHYSELLKRFYPAVEYAGVDSSPAMIAEAKLWHPGLPFRCECFDDAWLWGHDIVLVSQVLEYLTNPWAGLAHLFSQPFKLAILHRLRLTPDSSHRLKDEPTYCGNTGDNYLWNLGELDEWLAGNGTVVYRDLWSQQVTFVVKP